MLVFSLDRRSVLQSAKDQKANGDGRRLSRVPWAAWACYGRHKRGGPVSRSSMSPDMQRASGGAERLAGCSFVVCKERTTRTRPSWASTSRTATCCSSVSVVGRSCSPSCSARRPSRESTTTGTYSSYMCGSMLILLQDSVRVESTGLCCPVEPNGRTATLDRACKCAKGDRLQGKSLCISCGHSPLTTSRKLLPPQRPP